MQSSGIANRLSREPLLEDVSRKLDFAGIESRLAFSIDFVFVFLTEMKKTFSVIVS